MCHFAGSPEWRRKAVSSRPFALVPRAFTAAAGALPQSSAAAPLPLDAGFRRHDALILQRSSFGHRQILPSFPLSPKRSNPRPMRLSTTTNPIFYPHDFLKTQINRRLCQTGPIVALHRACRSNGTRAGMSARCAGAGWSVSEGAQAGMIAKEEFAQHAKEEGEHLDLLAERINQLGGKPDLNPEGLASRAASEYVEGENLLGDARS